ncbi:MAG: cytochrome c [Acidobacteria bacterium Pan2503]|uniref:Cytochrome c n=1 Tax=Candidatus Acidiferrum panamense TaxID=2741543 RepID=A0A7V8T0N0_9BACT|nr:cytochrome c [Candidatus Acidoferrum panamensis]
MAKGFILGIVVAILLVGGSLYAYFSWGFAPVATSASPMPLERRLARRALHAYLDKLPHPQPMVEADEPNLIAGSKVYKEQCVTCHGLPGEPKSAVSQGMFPAPPQLFHGVGVTDDEPWETYWKVENGIRMTGMPAFKGQIPEKEIWQVTMLVKNADKITEPVKKELLAGNATPMSMAMPDMEEKPEKQTKPAKQSKPKKM